MLSAIEAAIEKLGPGALDRALIAQHVRPLFARTLAGGKVYLANHSLGRPLDAVEADLAEGARLWGGLLRDAWTPWLAEEQAYRAGLASLLHLPRADCVVPRVSAGSALRAVLNTLPAGATVLTTDAEFVSVSVVLAQYVAAGRLRVVRAAASGEAMSAALLREKAVSLAVVSQVLYADARLLPGLPALARACREQGAALLVDCYHALGVVPVDMAAMDCDYLIGGCYKYLRGGPGAAFLALSPRVADAASRPLDIGWFAQQPGTDAWQEGGPALLTGGEGWSGATPPVLTYYQARSGLAFTRAMGVERLRAYSLAQLHSLRAGLAEHGIASEGGNALHGAFLSIATPRADEIVMHLAAREIVVDAREGRVRVCPDVLTTREEMDRFVSALAGCW